MALVTMKEILLPARREKRAVGAFNIANYETARSIIQAAEAEKSPVIIQLYMRLFDSTKAFDLAGALIRMAHRCNQPVALHLDHGDNVGQVKDALAWGYTSVMYDGSRLPFEENVRITRFCVDYAKAFGASVEGDLTGHEIGLEGSLVGNITCSGSLTLGPGSTVTGDIATKDLTTALGARINGRVEMKG